MRGCRWAREVSNLLWSTFPKSEPPSKFCFKQIVISNYRGSTKTMSWWEQDNFWHQYFSITPLQYSILRIHFISSYQLAICSNRMELLHLMPLLLLCTEQEKVKKFASHASLNFTICAVVQWWTFLKVHYKSIRKNVSLSLWNRRNFELNVPEEGKAMYHEKKSSSLCIFCKKAGGCVISSDAVASFLQEFCLRKKFLQDTRNLARILHLVKVKKV